MGDAPVAAKWCRDLNHFYKHQPALWEHDYDFHGFQWIDANDNENSVYSYIRFADNKDDLSSWC